MTAWLKYFIDLCGTTINAPLQKNEYIIWDSLPDQRNAIKDDYLSMKNELQSIKHQFQITSPEFKSTTALDKLSQAIKEFESFQILIQKGIQDRIYIMEDQGSHIIDIEIIGVGENIFVNKREKISQPSSKTESPRNLVLELGEQIIQRVWDVQTDKLSGILHATRGRYATLHYLGATR